MFILFADRDQLAASSAAKTVQTGGQILFRDQQCRRHQLDAIGEFAFRQPPIQASRDDAKMGGGKLDLDVLRAVARKQRHAIAANKPVARQHGCQSVNAIQQLAVADQTSLIFDRRPSDLCICARARNSSPTVGVAPAIFVGDLMNAQNWHLRPSGKVRACPVVIAGIRRNRLAAAIDVSKF